MAQYIFRPVTTSQNQSGENVLENSFQRFCAKKAENLFSRTILRRISWRNIFFDRLRPVKTSQVK